MAESHAGYTYCGVASLVILDELHKIDRDRLLYWMVNRQTAEGGFNGRINKLVDACYNFWLGSIGIILGCDVINKNALRTYTLCCC